MEFRTVTLLGAGAIGAYFVWGLSDKLGDALTVAAEGPRAETLKRDGLIINGKHYPLHVKTPEEAKGTDLLLVCVKATALRAALPSIAKIADGRTVVMSLLNGIDSEEIVAECIDRRRILYSLMKIASERHGNEISFNGPGTMGLYYGEPDTAEITERMRAVETLFSGTPLHCHPCGDIRRQMWYKFAINVSRNLPQAVLGIGAGAYTDSEHVAYLCTQLREEVIAVAAARGIDISEKTGDGTKYNEVNKRARYSTLQDLDAKRPTEIDTFAGAMIRMGKKYGVPVPCSAFIYHEICALEEKNRGRFDYDKAEKENRT
jgi:2-dehydropantoate 2-reductase